MNNEMKAAAIKREERYSMLSAYLNRWASVIVFASIVALAAGALFIESDDLAHLRVTIGVCAFDSTRSHDALESFGEFCREKGCGDIRWRFCAPGAEPTGCEFYLLPALSAASRLAEGRFAGALLIAEREAHRYSRSAVIVRAGVSAIPACGRIIFSSPVSAAGFVAPYSALERAGAPLAEATIAFSGDRARDDRTVLAVIHGVYDAGGISFERLAALEATGVFNAGEIDVLLEGEAVPELLLVCERAEYTARRRSFVRALRRVFDQAPRSLRRELAAIGIAALYETRDGDMDRIAALADARPAIAGAVGAAALPGGGSGSGGGARGCD